MNHKQPVRLKSYSITRYGYQKLRVCKHCKNFTMLSKEECRYCDKNKLISLDEHASLLVRDSNIKVLLIALLIAVAAVLFGDSTEQRLICGTIGLIVIIVLWRVQVMLRPQAVSRQLLELIKQEQQVIVNGVFRDWEVAIENWNKDKPLTYAMLREIATLMHNDTIRLQQLHMLDSFILRKDMDLELEPLLLRHFEPLLANYIGEVAKLKRDLIRDRTFRYVLRHEHSILRLESGLAIMTAVVGAALRTKHYIASYSPLVRRYAFNLPKDRFLRLYRMLAEYPDEEWEGLPDEVYRIYQEKYRWDADFH
ncbi:hypothetical protein [Paenibacillus agilis]|uniref:hypothetical protein n=1 Tax=Paenibacillus agilis TaxID=3020863 RepID=UPI0021BDAB7E|nr:hypothetical protein [Paenibacillus agilis]